MKIICQSCISSYLSSLCVCSFMCVQVRGHMASREQTQVNLPRELSTLCLRKNLTGSYGLPIGLGWLASSPHGCSVSVSHTVSSF